jgi:UDP-N-acetylmuramoyl-tripeptide--D-alanyl-D-alanine ligase
MGLRTSLEAWLGQQAKKVLLREHPFVITVSGAVGKTTTKRAIGAMLACHEYSAPFRVSPKSYNNELGVPLTVFGHEAPSRSVGSWLRLLKDAFVYGSGLKQLGVKTFVFEIGADKPNDLDYLLKLLTPDIAVVSAVMPDNEGLTPVHTSNFSSAEGLVEEETKPVAHTRPEGTVVLNIDDRRVFAMRHATVARCLTFGQADGADVQLLGQKIVTKSMEHGEIPMGLELRFQVLQREETFYVPGVFGTSVAYAVGAALTVAVALEFTPEEYRAFTHKFEPYPGRTRIIPGIKGTALYDDTYNASPTAVLAGLRDLAATPTREGQRKIACLGEMRELGESAERMHRFIGAEAARLKIDQLVLCGRMARVLADGALANGMSDEQVKLFEDVPEAGQWLQRFIKPGDIVFAKASEGRMDSVGARMERVIKELMAEPNRAGELLVRQDKSWERYS